MKKINQYDIAKAAGISGSYFSQLLAGDRHATYLTGCRLAQEIGGNPVVWCKGGGSAKDRVSAVYEFRLKQTTKSK